MTLSRYKPLFTITPIKIVGAVATTLVILVTIDIGGTSREVGLVVALSFLGNLLGALIWSRILGRKGNYVNGILLGYLILTLAISLLSLKTFVFTYIVAFLVTFLTNLIYFSLLFFIVDNYKDDLELMVGRLETIGGWSWVSGLIFGVFASEVLPLRTLVATLSAILFIAVILSIILLVSGIKEKIKEMVEEEEGLLPLLDKGLEKIIDFEERLPSILFSGIHVIFSGALFYSPAYLRVRLPKKEKITLYIGISMVFISFGAVYTQLVKHIKDMGYPDSTVYLLTLVGSILSALTYLRAGDKNNPLKRFTSAGIIRSAAFILLAGLSIVDFPYQIALLFTFYIISGYTWAYLVINMNLYALKNSKEEVGVTNFFSNVGLFIGSLSSGAILAYVDYSQLYIVAATLLILGATIVYLSSKKI